MLFLQKIFQWWIPATFFLVFLLSWELVCTLLDIPEYLIPSPLKVSASLYNNLGKLAIDSLVTGYEALAGFAIANFLSIILAVAFSYIQWLERSVYPYLIALKSTPVVAMAPLFVIWFGYGYMSKILMAALISFFPLVVNATVGLKSVPQEEMDVSRSLSASRWQILLKLRFPYAMPYIFSALKVSSTMAVVGAVIAEMSGASKGLGHTLIIASYTHDTALLFAAILASSLMGIAFFICIVLLERKLLDYQPLREVSI